LKRRELERHLTDSGCEVLRDSANDTIWHNPARELRAPVPRHTEIPIGTARAICRQLVVTPPDGPTLLSIQRGVRGEPGQNGSGTVAGSAESTIVRGHGAHVS
jgi:hypothetical protein